MCWNLMRSSISQSAYKGWMMHVKNMQVWSNFSIWYYCFFQLAQLLAELNSIPDLFPVKTPASTPSVRLRTGTDGATMVMAIYARLLINMLLDKTLSPTSVWIFLGFGYFVSDLLLVLFKYWSFCEEMVFYKIIVWRTVETKIRWYFIIFVTEILLRY